MDSEPTVMELRVARRMYDVCQSDVFTGQEMKAVHEWDSLVDLVKYSWVCRARYVIDAMRDPTMLMMVRGAQDDLAYDGDPGAVWTAMIDAASPPMGAP
jgi:hypothetical protein